MNSIIDYQNQIKNDNNYFYYDIYSLINSALAKVLNLYDFHQVLNEKISNEKDKYFWIEKEKVVFKYLAFDRQHASHLAHAINDKVTRDLKETFNLSIISGTKGDSIVAFVKTSKGYINFLKFKIFEISNSQQVNLRGVIGFDYKEIIKLISDSNNFYLSPIQISIFPIQNNNLNLRKFIIKIEKELSKNYRIISDFSEAEHNQKINLSKTLKIPYSIAIGEKDLKIKNLNLFDNLNNKYIKTNLKNLKRNLNSEHQMPINATSLCSNTKCLNKVAKNNQTVIYAFNQIVNSLECEVCKKAATKKVYIIKEVSL